jgi:proteasome lid subunit RPN8/RPN11
MIAQARAELPNECCGILAGTIALDDGIVSVRYPIKNDRASPVEFESEPRGLFAAHKDMRHRGLEMLAIYHSHPTSAPVPSATDLARNWYGEDVVNLIIGLAGAEPVVRVWRLAEADFREADWQIVE